MILLLALTHIHVCIVCSQSVKFCFSGGSSQNIIGPIIGGVLGGLCALFLLLLLIVMVVILALILHHRKSEDKATAEGTPPQPV